MGRQQTGELTSPAFSLAKSKILRSGSGNQSRIARPGWCGLHRVIISRAVVDHVTCTWRDQTSAQRGMDKTLEGVIRELADLVGALVVHRPMAALAVREYYEECRVWAQRVHLQTSRSIGSALRTLN